jgi:hypothetical protein
MLEQLTSAQNDLIPLYYEKWNAVARSRPALNRQEITATVKTAYALLELQEPVILFFDSPYLALDQLLLDLMLEELEAYLQEECRGVFLDGSLKRWEENLKIHFRHYVNPRLGKPCQIYGREAGLIKLGSQVVQEVRSQITQSLEAELKHKLNWLTLELAAEDTCITMKEQLSLKLDKIWQLWKLVQRQSPSSEWFPEEYGLVEAEVLVPECMWLDFCISALGCTVEQQNWNVLKKLAQCGWIYSYETMCVVCGHCTQH